MEREGREDDGLYCILIASLYILDNGWRGF